MTDELYRRLAADGDALQALQARTMEVAVAQAKNLGVVEHGLDALTHAACRFGLLAPDRPQHV